MPLIAAAVVSEASKATVMEKTAADSHVVAAQTRGDSGAREVSPLRGYQFSFPCSVALREYAVQPRLLKAFRHSVANYVEQ